MRKLDFRLATVILIVATPLAAASAQKMRGREAHQQQRIGQSARA